MISFPNPELILELLLVSLVVFV